MELNDLLNLEKNISITIGVEELNKWGLELIKQAIKKADGLKQEEPQFISAKQAASMLHCDLSTIWRHGKRGYLNPVRVGGKVLYKLSDINAILQK